MLPYLVGVVYAVLLIGAGWWLERRHSSKPHIDLKYILECFGLGFLLAILGLGLVILFH